MSEMKKHFIPMVLLACTLMFTWSITGAVCIVKAEESPNSYLTTINSAFMITPDEAQEWHVLKDKGGPTFSGNESWRSYMAFLEMKLKNCGVVDISKNKWTYERW